MTEEYHEFGEIRQVAGQQVVIATPGMGKKPVGLTFLLTAANISVNKYKSIRDALLKIDHVVVGFYINALNPVRNNHRTKAEKVVEMWDIFKVEFKMKQYGMVGHSVGGKIALLVAAAYDDDHSVRSVVALDPVDQTPAEFTSPNLKQNLSLKDSKANIVMTYTDTGFFVKKEHNARSIHKYNQNVKLISHRNAGHMCYCDEEEGVAKLSWKIVMNNGDPQRNEVAKREALRIIKERGTIATPGGLLKSAKRAVSEEYKTMSEDVKKATQGGAAKMFLTKSMGF